MPHSYRCYLFLLLISSVLFSCKDDSIVNTVSLNLTSLQLDGNGDKATLVISSSASSWAVESSVDWCTLSPESGDTKIGTVTVVADTNLTFVNREATITVSAPDADNVMVSVTQGIPDSIDLLLLSKTDIIVESSDTTIVVTLESKTNSWTATTPSDWLSANIVEGNSDTYEISITVSENTGQERISYFNFKGNGSNNAILRITQEAPPYPSYADPIEADKTGMESDAKTLASKIYLGWNLGNSLEVPSGETGWGNPKTTKTLIDSIKAAGFNAVRIPCAWYSHIDNTLTCKISDTWIERVKEVVDYCVDNDMYVVLNIHWDGGWLEENCTSDKKEENNAKQKALWEQIAMNFRNYDEHLLFAGTNEPNVDDATEMSVLLSYEQTFIDAVRSTGGRNAYRVLIFQGPATDIEKTVSLMKTLPSDEVEDRLMAEVHYYTPWNFCGMTENADWGNMFYYWGTDYHSTTDTDYNATYGEESALNSYFSSMKKKFVNNDIPLILGEFGAVRRTNLTGDALTNHLTSRAYYLKYVTQQAKKYGLIPFYWDNGDTEANGFAIINRKTKAICDQQALDSLIEGANEGVYPF